MVPPTSTYTVLDSAVHADAGQALLKDPEEEALLPAESRWQHPALVLEQVRHHVLC